MKKDVALVLSSGGSRGLAHIGVIDVLLERGFHISSISGTSMGALVAGMYAAGGLEAFKEWMQSVDKLRVLSLMDFTISNEGILKGEKIIEELQTVVPDVRIEDLPIPFTAVSTDIRHRQEIVFDKGSLYEAIRASISVPTLFKPHRIDSMLLIDGGVVNPLPLNRVRRKKGDLLFAVDLNAPCVGKEEPEDMRVMTILNEAFDLMIQHNSEMMIGFYKPDVLARIAMNAYRTLEFYKYEEILELGRDAAVQALSSAGL